MCTSSLLYISFLPCPCSAITGNSACCTKKHCRWWGEGSRTHKCIVWFSGPCSSSHSQQQYTKVELLKVPPVFLTWTVWLHRGVPNGTMPVFQLYIEVPILTVPQSASCISNCMYYCAQKALSLHWSITVTVFQATARAAHNLSLFLQPCCLQSMVGSSFMHCRSIWNAYVTVQNS